MENQIDSSIEIEKIVKQEENGFFGFFVKNFRMTFVLIGVILVVGTYCMLSLPREAEPEVKIPYAAISIIYPGANPTDVEELAMSKVEDQIKNVEKVKTFSGQAGTGFGSIFVEFEADADMDSSINKLKDAVDRSKSSLPSEVEAPLVSAINITDIAVVTYSLSGKYSDGELRQLAEVLEKEFKGVGNVSKVAIVGGAKREIQILVDPQKLIGTNLDITQIIGAISRGNFNLPAGDIEVEDYKYNVRVKGKFETVADLGNLPLRSTGGSTIYLRDIAQIKDGFQDQDSISRIATQGRDPENAVSLQIYKSTGGNIVDIVTDTQKIIDKMREENRLPGDLQIIKTNDNAQYIKEDLGTLVSNAWQTMLLILILLLVTVGLRSALVNTFALPTAFLLTFIFVKLQDMTLNSMVLFSLVLALGMMVDNSIVIMSGINDYIKRLKVNPYQAALLTLWDYKWSVISGTMTTVAAFLPILLVSGIMGEYMSILPKTVTAALVSSLFVALTIVPATIAVIHKPSKPKAQWLVKYSDFFSRVFLKAKNWYIDFLNQILPVKAKRKKMICWAFGLFFIVCCFPIIGLMKIEMFPKINMDYFVINVKLPVGSSLEKTSAVTAEAEKIVSQIPELSNFVTNIGTSIATISGESSGNGSHLSSIVVNLKDKDQRDRKSYEIATGIREQIESISGGIVTLEELSAGPPSGSPVEVRIFGSDLKDLAIASQAVQKTLQDSGQVINIKDSLEESAGEFVFEIDKEKAMYYGLDTATLALNLRQAVYGVEATTMNIEGDDIEVQIKYPKNELLDIENLKNITLMTASGSKIQLRQVAEVKLEPSVLDISHLKGEKVVKVTANLDQGANLTKVFSLLNKAKSDWNLPDGYRVEIGGEMEDIQKSYSEMFVSMFLAIFLIAIILLWQFNSFKQAAIIMFTLPLGITGALLGLTLLGLPFSLPAFIGIVSLAGIVVNNAIIMIDRINKNLASGKEIYTSAIDAGLSRIQPILLTASTTILGVLPLALSQEMWRGLGFSIIFGLFFSTLATLVFVPILYVSFYKKTA